MKPIEKQGEPELLARFKQGESPDWRASFAALNDDPPVKEDLKAALLAEQGYLCCYCCGRVAARSSHIEHFLSQETHPELDLEYRNLLASCNSEGRELHCGARKANRRIEVSPMDRDCGRRFAFDLQGGIAGDSAEAGFAIQVLGLDTRLLTENRRQAIRGYTDGIDELSDGEIQSLVLHLERRDAAGKFEPYQPAIVQALQGFSAAAAG